MTFRNGFVAADARGRAVTTHRPPRRIVSLVPSETESVVALGRAAALVGRTDYCAGVAGAEHAPSVGGTKGFDPERVLALEPDLVLANREENAEIAVRRLLSAGANVHVSFPIDLVGSVRYLESLAALLHAPSALVDDARALTRARRDVATRARGLVLIWKEPWMSVDARTYASDVMRAVGLENVCAARPRRYPLAADVGAAEAAEPGARDTRYPRLAETELVARDPDVVLLPDEPYAFGDADVAEVARLLPRARVVPVRGAWLFWYGARMISAIGELERAIGPVLDRGRG